MVLARLTDAQKRLFIRQHYGIAGNHSAVKLCGWTKNSLHDRGVCYKQKFYGIESHRCLQCTPIVNWCTQNCDFCWRLGRYQFPKLEGWDEPKEIVDKMIEVQRKLLSGFPGAKVNMKKWKEAQNPTQVAISLAGEPTIYPKLSELIAEFHKRRMTTFLVTNGTLPENIEKLNPLPTQLYVTLAAPDKETCLNLCHPNLPDAWERLMRTLELLPKLNTRKVIRLTLVKGVNMKNPEKYAELIRRAKPHFIEAKAYMSVGSARKRLGLEHMPTHEEIVEFSKKLSKHLGIPIADEHRPSRVVLLTDLPKEKWKVKPMKQ